MNNDNEMKARAEAAARNAIQAYPQEIILICGQRIHAHYPEDFKKFIPDLRVALADAFEQYGLQEIAAAKQDGAREEREAIIALVKERLYLLMNGAIDKSEAGAGRHVGQVKELSALISRLTEREEESEREK